MYCYEDKDNSFDSIDEKKGRKKHFINKKTILLKLHNNTHNNEGLS